MVVHGPPAMVQVRLKDDEATIEAVATLNEKVLHLPKVRAEVQQLPDRAERERGREREQQSSIVTQ